MISDLLSANNWPIIVRNRLKGKITVGIIRQTITDVIMRSNSITMTTRLSNLRSLWVHFWKLILYCFIRLPRQRDCSTIDPSPSKIWSETCSSSRFNPFFMTTHWCQHFKNFKRVIPSKKLKKGYNQPISKFSAEILMMVQVIAEATKLRRYLTIVKLPHLKMKLISFLRARNVSPPSAVLIPVSLTIQ